MRIWSVPARKAASELKTSLCLRFLRARYTIDENEEGASTLTEIQMWEEISRYEDDLRRAAGRNSPSRQEAAPPYCLPFDAESTPKLNSIPRYLRYPPKFRVVTVHGHLQLHTQANKIERHTRMLVVRHPRSIPHVNYRPRSRVLCPPSTMPMSSK